MTGFHQSKEFTEDLVSRQNWRPLGTTFSSPPFYTFPEKVLYSPLKRHAGILTLSTPEGSLSENGSWEKIRLG